MNETGAEKSRIGRGTAGTEKSRMVGLPSGSSLGEFVEDYWSGP
jgi:hypothetical protein